MKLKILKKISFLFVFLLSFFFLAGNCFANSNSFVTIVNPIRGQYAWGREGYTPLSGAKLENSLISKLDLAATWLLRDDAIYAEELSEYFKALPENQEVGVFLEITPQSAEKANIAYPQGGVFWHDANKIFLSGYTLENRKKLIDTVFGEFYKTFGYYPKSVGAWHVDAFSAEYLAKKYGVTGVLICADQFGTDGYQIWGGYWGVPYFPSRFNILIPAKTTKNKLNVVVSFWAARDPQKGYGPSVEQSTYSVQVNDYIQRGLGVDYFKKLLDVYLKNENNKFSQLTIGLENDNDWGAIGNGYELQLEEIKLRQNKGEFKVVKMKDFSDWYFGNFKLSPEHQVGGWTMSPDFRLSVLDGYIQDLRIYNELWPEANLLTANPWGTLSLNNPYKVDTVRFETKVGLPKNSNAKELVSKFGLQKIPFKINVMPLLLFYSFTLLLLVWCMKKNIPLLLLIVAGSVSLSLTMIKSGMVYPYGMGFWGPNGHDGIWHVALIEQLSKLSFQHPTFSGTALMNYHIGFDLLIAFLHSLTNIKIINLYFQIIPPVLAILIGLLTYKLVIKVFDSKISALLSVFFIYFGGSFGWLVNFLKNGSLGGESMFWANQAISTLINPPFALSVVILLLGLLKLIDYLKKSFVKDLIICSLLFGVLIQIKVYAGILCLISLAAIIIINMILRSIAVNVHLGKVLFLSLGISLAVFLPFNYKASSLLVLSPFWFPRTMSAFSDRLGWFKLESARSAYYFSGKYLKWILAEMLGVLIFIVGNLGTRIIGFLPVILSIRAIIRKEEKSAEKIFLIVFLFFSLIFPLIFIQKGNPWNTIQFFYYFQFFMAIFAGVFLGKLWENPPKIVAILASILIIVFTLPTTVATLKNDYLPPRPPSRINIEELQALDYLSNQQKGIVLTYPFNPDWKFKFSEPKPLYAYETTAYVSALSGKQTFLEDEMNLEISNYEYVSRRREALRFFSTNDQSWARQFLEKNRINFIYLVKGQKMNLGLNDINSEKIFENGEVMIYKLN